MKPKILTLEELTLSSSEDPLKLAQYDKSLDAELTYIREQLEAIENIGGVSQGYVAGVAPYLPEGVALESFTTKVSKHQYGIVTESLGTGMKLLIAAGAVAALGGVIYLLHRMGKNQTPKITDKGPAVRPVIQAAKKGSDQIRVQMKIKLKNVNLLADLPEDKLARSKVYKDGELVSVADYVAGELSKDGISNVELGILTGTWKYLGSAPDQKQLPSYFSVFHRYLWKIKDNLEKVVAKGENAKESDIDLAEVDRLSKFLDKNPNSFPKWFEGNAKTKPPASADFGEISVFVRRWMSERLSEEDSFRVIHDFVEKDTQVFEKPDPEDLSKGLEHVTTEAETLAKGFEKLGKSLEDTKLPAPVSAMVKDMVNGMKESLQVCLLVHDIVKDEIKAYNRTVFAIGQYVVRYGKECKIVVEALKSLETEKQSEQPSNIQSQEELDKLMQSGDTFKL